MTILSVLISKIYFSVKIKDYIPAAFGGQDNRVFISQKSSGIITVILYKKIRITKNFEIKTKTGFKNYKEILTG
jgi:hypothetical protein